MKSIAILILALVVVACAHIPQTQSLPFFPQVKPAPQGLNEVWLTAGYGGTLVVEGGCVKLRSSRGNARTMLWYQGIELVRDEKGLLVRNTFTGATTRFGEKAEFGGGAAPDDFVEHEYPEVARRCGPPYAFGYPGR